jgi:YD repeat-containing protein
MVPVGRGIHFACDGLARLVRTFESLNDVQQTGTLKEYFYDVTSGQPQHLDTEFLAGRLSFVRAGGRSMFFGYDALGRPTTTSYLEGGEAFAQRAVLGAAGQIEALELLNLGTNAPPEHIRYAYDSALRLRAVDFEDTAGITEMWRALETDIFGRVLRSRLGNGTTEQFSYRDGGRRELQSKREEVQDKHRLVQYQGLDGAMLLKGISEESTITPIPLTTMHYEYDARNELARAIVQTPTGTVSDLSYSYDGLGNLTEVSDAIGPGSLEIRPDSSDPDRICSVVEPGAPVTPCTYRYDALGNVQTIGSTGTLFDYDGAGRMRAAQAGLRQASMQYDPFGSLTSLRVKDGQIDAPALPMGPDDSIGFGAAAHGRAPDLLVFAPAFGTP